MRLRILALCCATGAIAPAAAAAAQTKQVYMGTPPSIGRQLEKLSTDVDDYFPHTITIHQGDSVRFVPVGFHTVNFPGAQRNPDPLVMPQGTISGVNDEAGSPFWFNGRPDLQFNPAVFGPGKLGKSVTFNGNNSVQSGAPLSDKPKPMTVRFTRTGTFTYYCNIHPGMKGVVRVLPRRSAVPSAKADAASVRRQSAAAVRQAKRFKQTIVPAGIIKVGLHRPGGVELLGFAPSKATVKVGTTLTFKMDNGSLEDHTASTGPGTFTVRGGTGYLGDLANSFQSPRVDPRAVYPSEAPGGTPAQLTPSLHGNGFWNSGVIDASNLTPLPAAGIVTFAAPGTYQFHCLIHTNMVATVTVTG